MTLTPRQRAVVLAVAEPGVRPRLTEIGRRVGLSSNSSVRWQIHNLIAAGVLRRGPKDSRRTVSLAPGVAVSRNGLVARVVPVGFCPGCGSRPHHPAPCERVP